MPEPRIYKVRITASQDPGSDARFRDLVLGALCPQATNVVVQAGSGRNNAKFTELVAHVQINPKRVPTAMNVLRLNAGARSKFKSTHVESFVTLAGRRTKDDCNREIAP